MDLMSVATAASASNKPERGVNQLEIDGIVVEFPFDPYSCQVRFSVPVGDSS